MADKRRLFTEVMNSYTCWINTKKLPKQHQIFFFKSSYSNIYISCSSLFMPHKKRACVMKPVNKCSVICHLPPPCRWLKMLLIMGYIQARHFETPCYQTQKTFWSALAFQECLSTQNEADLNAQMVYLKKKICFFLIMMLFQLRGKGKSLMNYITCYAK